MSDYQDQRQQLQTRLDLAKECCVGSLRTLIHRDEGLIEDPEAMDIARRAMKQLGIARRNLRRFELMIGTGAVAP